MISWSNPCVMLKVAIILSIVAPAGIPLTASVLLTPVDELSGIASEMVFVVKELEEVTLPPLEVSSCAGLVGHNTVFAGLTETVVGTGLIATTVVVAFEVHPTAEVAVKLYVPEAARVTLLMVGFWLVEAKLFGPVQLNVVPISCVPDNVRVDPTHIGPSFAAETTGLGLTVMVTKVELSVDISVPQVTRNQK